MSTSYDEDKKVITFKNILNETFKFIKRCLFPVLVSVEVALMYMIQSESYTFHSEFISMYRKIDQSDMRAMWSIMFNAEKTTIDDIYQICFSPQGRVHKVIHMVHIIAWYI